MGSVINVAPPPHGCCWTTNSLVKYCCFDNFYAEVVNLKLSRDPCKFFAIEFEEMHKTARIFPSLSVESFDRIDINLQPSESGGDVSR